MPKTSSDERHETSYHVVHTFRDEDDGEWNVWLNTEVADFDGICLASGTNRDEARASARDALQQALEALK